MTSPASLSDADTLVEDEIGIWVIECDFGPHSHMFPGDWTFGGASRLDPRADVRWMPTTYQYFNERLDLLHTTQTPDCDDQAIDEFTKVASFGPGFKPKYIAVKRADQTQFIMLPVEYDSATDEVTDV